MDRNVYQGRELGTNGGGESGLRKLHRWNLGFVYFEGTVKPSPGWDMSMDADMFGHQLRALNLEQKLRWFAELSWKEQVLCRWKYVDAKLSHLTNSEVPLAFINLISETSVWLKLSSVWLWGHRWHWSTRRHQYTIAHNNDYISVQFTVPRGDMRTQDCSSPAAQRTVESHDKLLQEHAKQEATQKQGKVEFLFPTQRSLKGTSTMFFLLHCYESSAELSVQLSE